MSAVHAVVLIQCEVDEIGEAAQAIAEIEGVSEVYSVAGEFDLIAIVRVPAHEQLATVIPGGIAKVEGVERTETLISFQVYSKHDLERLFSLGFDEGDGWRSMPTPTTIGGRQGPRWPTHRHVTEHAPPLGQTDVDRDFAWKGMWRGPRGPRRTGVAESAPPGQRAGSQINDV